MTTKQIDLWQSKFGAEYAERNPITLENRRRLMRDWGRILAHAVCPRPKSALEVGCSIGRNLTILRQFIEDVHGIEPNRDVCEKARRDPALQGVTIQEGTTFALPYSDNSMDLVFTSGVLIHISPEELASAVDEIVRVARHYIVCIEYFSHAPEQVEYRGLEGYLFKRDFGGFYLDRHPSLKVLDYGFLWQRLDSSDNSNWWLFRKY